MTPLLIACAGAVGALLRWRLDQWVKRQNSTAGATTPTHSPTPAPAPLNGWGIGLVNVTGCALAGMLAALLAHHPGAWAVLGTGFLGGYTTFSTAVLDAWTHLNARRWRAGAQLLLGVWMLGSGACLLAYALCIRVIS